MPYAYLVYTSVCESVFHVYVCGCVCELIFDFHLKQYYYVASL